jgi:UDP-2,3-diacylglucosamine pyrophosphatase LpxH
MIIRLPPLPYRNSKDIFHFLFASDLHIGASRCDESLIRADLEWAKEHNARVFFNGDVFDAIWPSDRKRYGPTVLARGLRNADAVMNTALDYATKLLAPYAALIHMIGVGNHESKTVKYHSTDLTALLIERLQAEARKEVPGHTIHHGGYTGVIVQRFRRKGNSSVPLQVFYHHGFGATARVTKGLISFARVAAWVESVDVIWLGHLHHRLAVPAATIRPPMSGDRLVTRPVYHIQSGAYSGDDPPQLDEGGCYQPDYVTEQGYGPSGRGGIRMAVRVCQGGKGRPPRLMFQVML